MQFAIQQVAQQEAKQTVCQARLAAQANVSRTLCAIRLWKEQHLNKRRFAFIYMILLFIPIFSQSKYEYQISDALKKQFLGEWIIPANEKTNTAEANGLVKASPDLVFMALQ